MKILSDLQFELIQGYETRDDVYYTSFFYSYISLLRKRVVKLFFFYYLLTLVFSMVRVTPTLVFSVVLYVLCLSFVSYCWSLSCLSSDLTIFVCTSGIFECLQSVSQRFLLFHISTIYEGVDGNIINVLYYIYYRLKPRVKLDGKKSDFFNCNVCLMQGESLFPF